MRCRKILKSTEDGYIILLRLPCQIMLNPGRYHLKTILLNINRSLPCIFPLERTVLRVSSCSLVLQTNTAFAASNKNQPLTLHVLTRESSKPSIAAISRSIARSERRNPKLAIKDTFKLSINNLESHLEGNFLSRRFQYATEFP